MELRRLPGRAARRLPSRAGRPSNRANPSSAKVLEPTVKNSPFPACSPCLVTLLTLTSSRNSHAWTRGWRPEANCHPGRLFMLPTALMLSRSKHCCWTLLRSAFCVVPTHYTRLQDILLCTFVKCQVSKCCLLREGRLYVQRTGRTCACLRRACRAPPRCTLPGARPPRPCKCAMHYRRSVCGPSHPP